MESKRSSENSVRGARRAAKTLTGEQIRAGRSLARVDQAELARRSLVSLETIKRVERIRGPIGANLRTLEAITDAFASLGIVFDHSSGAEGVWRAPAVAARRD
jgi:transcriptional regulator with XRE-family HTH domain